VAGIGNGNPVPEGITGLGFLRDLGLGTEIAIPVESFTCMPLKKDGADLCAIKKVSRTCVPSS
jgi:hypothetical protein